MIFFLMCFQKFGFFLEQDLLTIGWDDICSYHGIIEYTQHNNLESNLLNLYNDCKAYKYWLGDILLTLT